MKKTQTLIFGLIIVILCLGLTTYVSAENEKVPDWIKNTAGWWATDAISETEFVNAIEFLVNENIIQVDVSHASEISHGVPSWIKNTAGWWANDNISDTEFINAIEFLVNNGIIQVYVNVDEKTSSAYNSFNEIVTDSTLSENQKLIEVDKLIPFYSGYRGAAFDGESVYFAPYYSNHGRHGWVIKFDTSKPFDDPNSWKVFNTASSTSDSKNLATVGFQGALYNNGHVYFVPYFISDDASGSKIVTYDTKLDFNDSEAWDWIGMFDAYEDGVVEKNFVYFSPHLDRKNNVYAKPLRLDSNKDLRDPTVFEFFDTKIHGSYIGAASDGEKIYYGPYIQTNEYKIPITDKSTILIYDTNKLFNDRNSWEYRSVSYGGYGGVGFNGTHIVFAPFCNNYSKENIAECSKIMFLDKDTQKISYSKISHSAYNGVIEADDVLYLAPRIDNEGIRSDFIQIKNSIEAFSPNIGFGGYWGGTYDGRHVYFSPYDPVPNSNVRNGEFLRYDTFQPFNNSDSWESISFSLCDLEPYNILDDCFHRLGQELR